MTCSKFLFALQHPSVRRMFFSKRDFRAELRVKFWFGFLCIDNFIDMYILFIDKYFSIIYEFTIVLYHYCVTTIASI